MVSEVQSKLAQVEGIFDLETDDILGEKEVKVLIAGVTGHICDSCISQAFKIVNEEAGAQGNQQQPQRQMMTPAVMPQMPGAVHPNATWASLLQMLSGGG